MQLFDIPNEDYVVMKRKYTMGKSKAYAGYKKDGSKMNEQDWKDYAIRAKSETIFVLVEQVIKGETILVYNGIFQERFNVKGID
jgi:hypothetical protein